VRGRPGGPRPSRRSTSRIAAHSLAVHRDRQQPPIAPSAGSAGLAGLAAARRACSATIDTDSAQVHLMAATHGDQLVLGQVGVEVKTNAKQQR
jgi:hypothetical protein